MEVVLQSCAAMISKASLFLAIANNMSGYTK